VITAIGVLAILATIAFTALNPIEQFRKAQDSKRKSDLAQLQRALEAYYQDFGRYPSFTGCCGATNTGAFPYTINELDGEGDDALHWGNTWAPYIDILPVEPNSNKFYIYWSDELNNFQSYRIYASLDRGDSDPDSCNGGLACANLPAGVSGCGIGDEICNYGVTSPNISP